MIFIKNSQKTIPFSTKLYEQKAKKIVTFLGYQDFDISIWLTTNHTLQKYNREFRHKNKPTDVLSFPFHDVKAGKKILATSPDDKNLGDILISVAYVFANKHNLEGDFIQRMDRMLVHGICHLLGYDHQTDNDYKKMFALEKKLLKLINT